MRATQHRSNNDVLGAPPDVPIEESRALPITRVQYPDGSDAVISYWRPSADELVRLRAGWPVRLVIQGRSHPPVSLGVNGDGWP